MYKTCITFICTIMFGLPESSKIILLKNLILELIKFKVTEKRRKKSHFPTLWPQIAYRVDL